MRIRTRVKIGGAVTICVLLAYGATVLYLDRTMGKLAQEVKEVNKIVNKITILRSLTQDYLLYRTERAQRQWATVYEEVLQLLHNPEYRVLRSEPGIGDAPQKLKIVGDTFSRLMTLQQPAGPDNPEGGARGELQNRLATQLLLATQDLTTRFFNLTETTNGKLIATQRFIYSMDILALFTLAALLISNMVFLQRSVIKPVLKLHEGAEIIGAGNLDHKVGLASHDEIGQLSQAFDRMTANLQQVTVSRDDLGREVEVRRRAQARIARQNAILEGIGLVFKAALTCETEEKLGETCLAVAEELTGSKFGFIDELNQEGKLDTIAISYLGWEVCKIPGTKALVMPKNLHLHGIYSACLREGRPEIVNDPANHPGRIGIPDGHPPITAFLGVPLKRGGDLIGLIGLGNKAGGFTDADREAVEALAPAMVEALMRRRAEEEVKRLASFPQMNPAPVLEVDLSGAITFYNRAALEAVEPLGAEADLGALIPEDLDEIAAAIKEKQEKFFYREVKIKGRVFSQNIFFAESFKVLRIYSMDITRRHQAEERLQRTLADLERSNQELEQFAYISSHDLQEPLRKIANFSDMLVHLYQGRLDEQAERYFGYITDGAKRMQALINDLLSYSRVGRAEMPLVPASLEEILTGTIGDLQTLIQESGAEISHDPLPALVVNPHQMGRLLQNLIANGIKFRDRKTPRIHLSARQEAREWVIAIRDNGIGFDAQYAENIFKVFKRLHAKEKYPGTGIGLAICQKIVERHGGRIWAESEPGQGATFYFTIPA